MKASLMLSKLHWKIEDAMLNAMVERDAISRATHDWADYQYQMGRVRAYIDALQTIQSALNQARQAEGEVK